MLVLSRRIGETIVIDGDIEVTVVSVRADRVRVGIKAPLSVNVDRQEIHERRERRPSSAVCINERKEGPYVLAAP
jgi:carbon storage regulator